jgi:uncharacterized protein (TIGR02145 family)
MESKNWLVKGILVSFWIGILSLCLPGCTKSSDTESPVPDTLPVLTTSAITGIASTSAIGGGTVTSDGGAAITARGVCWSTTPNPTVANNKTTDGTGSGSFASTLQGLSPSTPYNVRAYATNSAGTAYGNTMTFTTQPATPGTVTDFDGNIYHTKTIGTQVWMIENMKVTHYRNGDPITPGKGNEDIKLILTSGQFWNYNNDTSMGRIYGHLYNFYAVEDARSLAPPGWHIASDSDWTVLSNYLGADSVGGKLKEAGMTHWASPNLGATNVTGFTALPGGYRDTDGTFTQSGYYGFFWTSTQYSSVSGIDRSLGFNIAWMMHGGDDKPRGMSVRCVQGN